MKCNEIANAMSDDSILSYLLKTKVISPLLQGISKKQISNLGGVFAIDGQPGLLAYSNESGIPLGSKAVKSIDSAII